MTVYEIQVGRLPLVFGYIECRNCYRIFAEFRDVNTLGHFSMFSKNLRI